MIRALPAFWAAVHGILHPQGPADRIPFRPGGQSAAACIRSADGPPQPVWTPPRARYQRAVLDRLRERRVLDLLRARAGRVLRTRADAGRLPDHRRDLLPDR